jgi:hypothetical protein
MLKYNFYENEIKQYSKVKLITIINDVSLIEDVNTKNRLWVMHYDIYPLDNHDLYGNWIYDEHFQNIAKSRFIV